MKTIKIISIILAVLLAAGLAVALIVDSSREKERQQHISAMAEKEKKAKSLYLAGWIAIVLSYVLCFVGMRSAIAAFFIAFSNPSDTSAS